MEGNWSSTYTVVLQVTRNNQNVILVETFEDPLFTQWDNVVGDVTLAQTAQIPAGNIFSPAAVYQGMNAALNGENPTYLQYNLPGETNFQISFYFDPNSVDMGGGQHQIVTGLDHMKNLLFGIEVDEDAVLPNEYYIGAWVLTTAGIQYTPAFDLTDAPHKLTLTWNPSATEILVFTVDDSDFIVDSTASTASISGVTASDGDLYQMWFGPSVIEGANTQGVEYFDNINAIRQITDLFIYLPLINR